MSTSHAFLPLGENDFPNTFVRLRRHAAQVRALLLELERITQGSTQSSGASRFAALGEQLAEEVGLLGRLMLECASALTQITANPGQSDA